MSQPATSDTWRRTGPGHRWAIRSKSRPPAAALGDGRDAGRPLLIGSVKTNIGHLEAAAGIAGVIKVILSLEHEELPKHLHFQNPSPHIPWDRLPVRVVEEATAWERNDRPRIAGVSSFGFSGTNAHVILEEAPEEVGQAAAAPVGASRTTGASACFRCRHAARPPWCRSLTDTAAG